MVLLYHSGLRLLEHEMFSFLSAKEKCFFSFLFLPNGQQCAEQNLQPEKLQFLLHFLWYLYDGWCRVSQSWTLSRITTNWFQPLHSFFFYCIKLLTFLKSSPSLQQLSSWLCFYSSCALFIQLLASVLWNAFILQQLLVFLSNCDWKKPWTRWNG